MTRKEFSGKTMDKAYARANGKCELCGSQLQPGYFEYDHRLCCALGGDNSLDNCVVVCVPCHKFKTTHSDVPMVRKSDRQRKAHIVARPAPKRPIQSRGFAKREKVRDIKKTSMPVRLMYEGNYDGETRH